MKKILFLILILSQFVFAQTKPNRYEVEMLKNPNKGGKDTREVNAVLIFEKDVLKIKSRRNAEVFKEFPYSGIEFVEHSYSKGLMFSDNTKAAILTLLTGFPAFYAREEKHWMTFVVGDDFAVLKVENDNFRLLKNEFIIRKIALQNINEDK